MLITDLQTSAVLNSGGNGLLPTKTTLTGTTAAVQLQAQLLGGPGTANKDGRSKLRAWIAVSSFNITAAEAVIQMRGVAQELEVLPIQENGQALVKHTDILPACGLYAYVFLDVPVYSVPPTLNLKLVELN